VPKIGRYFRGQMMYWFDVYGKTLEERSRVPKIFFKPDTVYLPLAEDPQLCWREHVNILYIKKIEILKILNSNKFFP
jgi:hypothetical protein